MTAGEWIAAEFMEQFQAMPSSYLGLVAAVMARLGLWDAEVYTVEHEWGDGGSFPVGFDVAPDIGRVYVEPGDRVVVIRKEPK